MASLVYCEICGVLIKGPQSHAPIPEGVICDGCFESRRAVVTTSEPAAPESGAMVQFNCCYCYSLLRLKAVAKRTRIKCPKCADAFYLNPDGRLESRLEGNTTAIISPDQLLRPLTPTAGVSPLPQADASKTQPMRRDDTPALSKTQPMSRDLILPAARQQALLDELKPKKHASFLDDVPSRDAASAAASMVDTDRFEGKSLDLLPDDVGPGDAPKTPKSTPALRPSEEGRVDLDADGLRRKTAKYQQKQLLGKQTTKRRKQTEQPAPPEGDDERDEGKKERAKDKEREKDRAKDEQKREERDRRAADAQRKAQELESQRSKKSLGALSLTALCVLPTILAVLLLTMTTRGTGFATRGAFGDRMKDVGGAVDRGVRSLGGIVNPYLPPEYRLPQVTAVPR